MRISTSSGLSEMQLCLDCYVSIVLLLVALVFLFRAQNSEYRFAAHPARGKWNGLCSAKEEHNRIWNIFILHRDYMDHEDQEDTADEGNGTDGMVVLSTIIGSRTVTLDTVRYAIIHPAVRTSRMHSSGMIQRVETPITTKLEENEADHIARVSSGLATLLHDVEDSCLVLHSAS